MTSEERIQQIEGRAANRETLVEVLRLTCLYCGGRGEHDNWCLPVLAKYLPLSEIRHVVQAVQDAEAADLRFLLDALARLSEQRSELLAWLRSARALIDALKVNPSWVASLDRMLEER